jgi:hypothetical protein
MQVSSSNSLPLPRLPANPTRVDKLLIDSQREHARVLTLIGQHTRIPNLFDGGVIEYRGSYIICQYLRTK